MWITFQMQWTLLINTDTGVVGGGGGGGGGGGRGGG